MYYPYKVIVYLEIDSSTIELQDYGRMEDDNNYIKTAKRLITDHSGIKPGYITGLNKNPDRMNISDVPNDIKKEWTLNIKSIPIYYFKYSV